MKINLKRVGQLRNVSLVSKQWLVYSKLAVILGNWRFGFYGAISVRDLNVFSLFLFLITTFPSPWFVHGWNCLVK